MKKIYDAYLLYKHKIIYYKNIIVLYNLNHDKTFSYKYGTCNKKEIFFTFIFDISY